MNEDQYNSTQSVQSPSDPRKLAREHRAAEDLKHPSQIGPYKILELLGEGGMGLVYLAEQQKPIRRRVALKIIKLGMDTRQVLARFDTEREALALMNHANVAKVLDAGIADNGRPYFVMEHVPGVPITQYADTHRLTTRERLRLFIEVCHAVQHAHQKGIIHRDIKPSNVLVSIDPTIGSSRNGSGDAAAPYAASDHLTGVQVKVIDFGVAKAIQQRLTERTLFTEQGQLIGTPGYMSPEQAEMSALDVDTRTDIYSLGVLLYELLVGARPFDDELLRKAAYAEVQRIIREVDPPKPSTRLSALSDFLEPAEPLSLNQKSAGVSPVASPERPPTSSSLAQIAAHRRTEPRTLIRQLRGDLDWVIMKCLEKDRTRRYDSPNSLAAEIDRYLSKMPVLAGPPTVRYRFRKFVVRRTKAVIAGSIIAILLGVAGVSFVQSTMAARDALRQRASGLYYEALLDAYSRPDDALQKLQQVAILTPDFLDARIQRAYLLKRENYFKEALAEATALVTDHPDSGAVHLLLSLLYRDSDVAMSEFHRAEGERLMPHDRYYKALGLGPDQNQAAIDLLSSLLSEDGSHFDARWARAWRYYDLKDFEHMLEDAEFMTKLRPQTSTSWNMKGIALERLYKNEEALEAYNRSIVLAPDYPPNYINRAGLYVRMIPSGENQLARSQRLGKALADCNRALRLDPKYGLGLSQRAWVYFHMGLSDKAESDCLSALAIDENDAFAWHRLGNVLESRDNLERALHAYDHAVRLRPSLVGAWSDRCRPYYRLDRLDDALDTITHAVSLDPRDDIAWSRKSMVLHRLGRLQEADAALIQALTLNPGNADALRNRARVRRDLHRFPEAMADHDEAVRLFPGRNTYAARGITRRFMGEDVAALDDFQLAIAKAPMDTAPIRLWIWEILMLRGSDEDKMEAAKQLAAARTAATDPWDKLLVAAIADQMPEESLLAAATDSKKRCQAFYILGSRALVAGHAKEAKEFFRQCLEIQAVDLPEHDLAKMHTVGPRLMNAGQ